MRWHSAAQLILLSASGAVAAVLSLSMPWAHQIAPQLTALVGPAVLGGLWSLWLTSLWRWFRGVKVAERSPVVYQDR